MDVDLTLLLEIQDLRGKIRELEAGEALSKLEHNHFGIEAEEAIKVLRAAAAELEARLSEPVRRSYERIAGHLERVVVPVIDETCYGCFESIPAMRAREARHNVALQRCETCGRFLYFPE
ncbi:MAG: hypothetical protein ACE5GJ_05690 [Gemmatimonadota bacterium]